MCPSKRASGWGIDADLEARVRRKREGGEILKLEAEEQGEGRLHLVARRAGR